MDLETLGYFLFMEEQEKQDAKAKQPPSLLPTPAEDTPQRGKEK